jgi:hypothetical protein
MLAAMAYREEEFEDEDAAELDEREDPDPADQGWDFDAETVPCPYCGKEMAVDSPVCPHCRSFVSNEDAPRRRAAWWVIVGVGLCLLTAMGWVLSHG